MTQPSLLLLFDIDGTLMRSGPRPREWFAAALTQATGETIHLRLEDVMGSTDPLIIRTALEQLGYDEGLIQELAPEILTDYTRRMESQYIQDPAPKFLFKGVVELLETLTAREDCLLGLLTGNLEQIARLKLGHFGIWDYFQVGAFSSDAELRSDLPPIALHRASALNGVEYTAENTVIIGDTFGDLETARKNSMAAVIVGHTTSADYRQRLRNADPELYVENFEDPEPFLDFIDSLVR